MDQHQQINSGLTRYRSAPTSYFTSLLNSTGGEEKKSDQFLKPPHPYSSSRYAPDGITREDSSLHNPPEFDMNTVETEGLRSQSAASIEDNTAAAYSFSSHQSHNSEPVNQKPVVSRSAMDSSFRPVHSVDQKLPQMNIRGGSSAGDGIINLIRQSSSPAGFLSYFNATENDFSEMGGMGNSGLREGNGSESTFTSSRLRVQMDFSSRRMAPIPETSSSMGIGSPEGEIFGEAERSCGGYIPSFPIESWDDSMNLSRSFLELEDDDIKPEAGLNDIENQHVEDGKPTSNTLLSRHLSLPQSTMEKLLQFQDSVPFKTRAKRGCATHPRSVAERVRRTKISERIRKLQELVPNMDKQTNTADMLDLAVDYIKDLQRQAKILTESQANCTCAHKSDR